MWEGNSLAGYSKADVGGEQFRMIKLSRCGRGAVWYDIERQMWENSLTGYSKANVGEEQFSRVNDKAKQIQERRVLQDEARQMQQWCSLEG